MVISMGLDLWLDSWLEACMLSWNICAHGVMCPWKPRISLPSGLPVLILMMHGQSGTPLLLLNVLLMNVWCFLLHVYYMVSRAIQRLRWVQHLAAVWLILLSEAHHLRNHHVLWFTQSGSYFWQVGSKKADLHAVVKNSPVSWNQNGCPENWMRADF